MKNLILFLSIFIFGSCTPSSDDEKQTSITVVKNYQGNYVVYTVTYDSCEYLVFDNRYNNAGNQVLHKANCKNH